MSERRGICSLTTGLLSALLICAGANLHGQGINLAKYQPVTSTRSYQQDEAVDGIVHAASVWRSDNSEWNPWYEVDLQGTFSVRSAQVFTGTDSAAPCDKIRVEYWDGASWQTCPGADISGNTEPDLSIIFSSAVVASRFRLVFPAGYESAYLREFALYPDNGGNGYPLGADLNLNLASHWGVDASSLSSNTRYVVDGYIHADYQYVTDGSAGPHTLDMKMLWTQEVASVHLHTGAGAASPLSGFDLLYWDGAAWQACPGGSVTGNTDEHRIINFSSPVTTARIRLSFAGYGYIDEVVVLPGYSTTNYPANTSVTFGVPPAMEWMVYEDSWYDLVNRGNGRALTATAAGASQDSGTATADEKSYQLLYNYDTRDYRIRNRDSGDCLIVSNASLSTGGVVVEADYSAAIHQRWTLQDVGSGYFRIVNRWSGLALESDGAATATVTQESASVDPLQEWKPVYITYYPKKGSASSSLAGTLNESWNYGWTTDSTDLGKDNVDYPMQWGEKTSEPHTDLHRDYNAWNSVSEPLLLMAYNEPTRTDQANLTVEAAAEYFPVLAQMDLPMVGPSMMHAGTGTGEWHDVWYNQYMKPQGYDFEYLGVHVYRNASADTWISEIREFSELFQNKKVVVSEMNASEWGAGSWSEEDTYSGWAEFMYRAESLDFIKGYAAFAFWDSTMPASAWALGQWHGCMVLSNQLTAVGNLYKAWDGDTNVYANTSYVLHNLGCGSRVANVDSDSTLDGLPLRAEGAPLTQFHGTNTQWVLFNAPGGKFYIVSTVDGMRISYDGTNVSLAGENTYGPDVEWTLTEAEYGAYFLESHAHGYERLRLNRPSTSPLTYTVDTAPQSALDTSVQFRFIRSVEPAAVPTETPPPLRGDTDASQSRVAVAGAVQKGTWVTITIQAANSDGVLHESGGAGTWTVDVTGANSNGLLTVTDNGDGTYSATYFAVRNGTDALDIRLNGVGVGSGTPYTVTVQDSPLPALTTLPATVLGTNTAFINYVLEVSTTADVTVFWGANDGLRDPGAWDANVDLGATYSGTQSHTLTNLSPASIYFFTCRATNENGAVWGATRRFSTGLTYNELLDTANVAYGASSWTDGLPTADDHLLSNGGRYLYLDWSTLQGSSFTINNSLTRFEAEGGNTTPGRLYIGGAEGIMWNGSADLANYAFYARGGGVGNTLYVEAFAFRNNNTGNAPVKFYGEGDDFVYLQLDTVGSGEDIVFYGGPGSSGYLMIGNVFVTSSVSDIGTGDGFASTLDVQTAGSINPSGSLFLRDGTIDINADNVIGDDVTISLEDAFGGDAVFDISGATDNVGDLRATGSGGIIAVDATTSYVFGGYNEGPVAITGFSQGSTIIRFDGVSGAESLGNMTINGGPATWSDIGGGVYQLSVAANWTPSVSAPRIQGRTAVGRTLRAVYSYNDAEADPDVSTIQWYRRVDGILDTNDSAIAGATGTEYLLQEADVGYYLFFRVTPRASSGTTPGVTVASDASDRIAGDSDGDGMDDEWEYIHGLDPYGASDADGDADGDGMSNLEEYLADTDPSDPESLLAITGLIDDGSSLHISWMGGTRANQYLEYSTNILATNAWVTVYTNQPDTTVSNSLPGLLPAGGKTFYRIRAVVP